MQDTAPPTPVASTARCSSHAGEAGAPGWETEGEGHAPRVNRSFPRLVPRVPNARPWEAVTGEARAQGSVPYRGLITNTSAGMPPIGPCI